MSLVKLADYVWLKYSNDEKDAPDTSFGVSINPIKTRILKDKLILTYDKINKDITSLPAFRQMNKDLANEPALQAFNDVINDLVVNIENLSLKEGFSYAIQMIRALNQLRRQLPFLELNRDKKIQLDANIKNVQDTIWKESKSILNIHDLRGLELEFPELKRKLDEIVPTWNFGPMKSIVRKQMGQRPRGESVKDMIERLEKENKLEKK